MVAEGPRGRQGGKPALDPGGIGRQNIAEQHGQRPAVQQQVVMGPDPAPDILAGADQGEAHDGSAGEVQAQAAVRGKQRFEPGGLFGCGDAAPVFPADGDGGMGQDDLMRLRHVLPDEQGAERWMQVDDVLPCQQERRFLKAAGDQAGELLDIDAGFRLLGGVEQHAQLQRGQRIGVGYGGGQGQGRCGPASRRPGGRAAGRTASAERCRCGPAPPFRSGRMRSGRSSVPPWRGRGRRRGATSPQAGRPTPGRPRRARRGGRFAGTKRGPWVPGAAASRNRRAHRRSGRDS